MTIYYCNFQISAQESRRKKKEYMDQLERKVELLLSENNDYRKRVESLEQTNAKLLSQMAAVQALVTRGARKWRHTVLSPWRHQPHVLTARASLLCPYYNQDRVLRTQ